MKDNAPKLGQTITGEAFRDAIHIAVAPVKAGMKLSAGSHVHLVNGEAFQTNLHGIGVVDPFLKSHVPAGEMFYLFLYPGSITALRHEWSHPSFPIQETRAVSDKSESEQWMRKWAMKHMGEDYYGEGMRDEESAYQFAIQCGHDMSVGPYEDARDYINDTWWDHWEKITGFPANRGEYFYCGC